MKKLFLPFLFPLISLAQLINFGTTEDANLCTTSSLWKPGVPGYTTLPDAPYDTLRYGTNFTCNIPVATNGFYIVELYLIEPSQNGPNLRVFTISANGSTSKPIDLFKLAGLKVPFLYTMFVPVNDFNIKLDFKATVRTAVVAGVRVKPMGISDLPPGEVTGRSIKLQNGGFLDVSGESLETWNKAVSEELTKKFGPNWWDNFTVVDLKDLGKFVVLSAFPLKDN